MSFKKEADLCAAFIAAIDQAVWTPYAETAGWDILLVRKADGFQIGIQAKLKLNAHVLNQAAETTYDVDRGGPDCRAVLVPHGGDRGLETLAAYVGITVISFRGEPPRGCWWSRYQPSLPGEQPHIDGYREYWFEMCPVRRETLPDYVPEHHLAGRPSPITLTHWKVQAMRLCITMERRGYLTRQDFKYFGVDHRRWMAGVTGWLAVENGRYVKGTHFPDYRREHPKVYAEIEADFDTWSRKDIAA